MKLSEVLQEIIKELDNPEKREVNFRFAEGKPCLAMFFDQENTNRQGIVPLNGANYSKACSQLAEIFDEVSGGLVDGAMCAEVICDAVLTKSKEAVFTVGVNEESGRYVGFSFVKTLMWFRFDNDPKVVNLADETRKMLENIFIRAPAKNNEMTINNGLGESIIVVDSANRHRTSPNCLADLGFYGFTKELQEMGKNFWPSLGDQATKIESAFLEKIQKYWVGFYKPKLDDTFLLIDTGKSLVCIGFIKKE